MVIFTNQFNPFNFQATRENLETNFRKLKDLQLEIYEKCFNALTQIPVEVLEHFPKFDAEALDNLKMLAKRVKAKTLRIGKTLKEVLELDEEKGRNSRLIVNSAFPALDEFEDFTEPSPTRTALNNSWESPNVSYQSLTERIKNSQNLTMKIRQEEKIQEKLIDNSEHKSTNLTETPINSPGEVKKHSFKLKRPIKTKMELSNELWEKGSETRSNSFGTPERKLESPVENKKKFEKIEAGYSGNYYDLKKKPSTPVVNEVIIPCNATTSWSNFNDGFGNYITCGSSFA